jgi:purine-nucleoside phosphorylase
LITQTAIECKVNIKEGTYSSVKGPCYETKAEIRMLEIMGADLVGMSTVPEVIIAKSENIQVAGISLITNRASGYYPTKLSHEEVQLVADEAKEKFSYLLEMIINKQIV